MFASPWWKAFAADDDGGLVLHLGEEALLRRRLGPGGDGNAEPHDLALLLLARRFRRSPIGQARRLDDSLQVDTRQGEHQCQRLEQTIIRPTLLEARTGAGGDIAVAGGVDHRLGQHSLESRLVVEDSSLMALPSMTTSVSTV